MNVASIIIADENEGRRNLLANTFEREGYDVTRLGTLTQTEATAGAVLPDVLLLEGEWSEGAQWTFAKPLESTAFPKCHANADPFSHHRSRFSLRCRFGWCGGSHWKTGRHEPFHRSPGDTLRSNLFLPC